MRRSYKEVGWFGFAEESVWGKSWKVSGRTYRLDQTHMAAKRIVAE